MIFRFGVGHDVLGLYRVSQIEGWVPIFLFAMLFGLSMDYEVFFVTRCASPGTSAETTGAPCQTGSPTPGGSSAQRL